MNNDAKTAISLEKHPTDRDAIVLRVKDVGTFETRIESLLGAIITTSETEPFLYNFTQAVYLLANQLHTEGGQEAFCEKDPGEGARMYRLMRCFEKHIHDIKAEFENED